MTPDVVYAIAPAGGHGSDGRPPTEAVSAVGGRPILAATLRALARQPAVAGHRGRRARGPPRRARGGCLARAARPEVLEVVAGGATRQESVWRALQARAGRRRDRAWCTTRSGRSSPRTDRRVRTAAAAHGAALCALPIGRRSSAWPTAWSKPPLDRPALWLGADAAGLPRARCCGRLTTRRAATASRAPTTRCWSSASGRRSAWCPAWPRTSRSRRRRIFDAAPGQAPPGMTVRSGFGFDLHPLVDRPAPVLGGVTVAAERRTRRPLRRRRADPRDLRGAARGAGAGRPRPAVPGHRSALQGVSSLVLLGAVMELGAEAGRAVVNVDATVLAQAPRLAPHLPEMAKRLAGPLGLAADQVSVKAKSPEDLGLLGRRGGDRRDGGGERGAHDVSRISTSEPARHEDLQHVDPREGGSRPRSSPARCEMYVCGVTVYDFSHVGHARMLIVFDVIRATCASSRLSGDVRRELHRHRRQDHPAREPGGRADPRDLRALHRGLPRRHGALGVLPPDVEPEGDRAHPRDHRADRAPDRERHTPTRSTATSTSRSRRSRRTASSRARTSTSCRPARASRSTSASATRVDFALWKAAKPGEPSWRARGARAGRAGTSSARRWRCSYLGEHVRHPRRRRGPDLPAPRERDRAVGGRHRQAVRALLAAQRLREPRRREDVEVARQHAHDPGPGAPPRPGGAAAATCSAPTTATRSSSPTSASRGRGRALERFCAPLEEEAERTRPRHGRGPGPRRGPSTVAAQRERFEAAMDDDFNTPQALGVLFDLARSAPRRARAGGAGHPRRGAFVQGVGELIDAGPAAGAARGTGPAQARHRPGAQGPDRLARGPGTRRGGSGTAARADRLAASWTRWGWR